MPGEPRRMAERSLYLWADDDGNFGRGIDGESVAGRICRRSVAPQTYSPRDNRNESTSSASYVEKISFARIRAKT